LAVCKALRILGCNLASAGCHTNRLPYTLIIFTKARKLIKTFDRQIPSPFITKASRQGFVLAQANHTKPQRKASNVMPDAKNLVGCPSQFFLSLIHDFKE